MIPPREPNALTTECGNSTRQVWSPPAVLIEAAAGNDGLILRLIDAFGSDTDARMEQIRMALAASDFPHVRAEAHTIKGGARQMGADEVAAACQDIENACTLQEASLVTARLNRLQELFSELRGAMAAYSNPG